MSDKDDGDPGQAPGPGAGAATDPATDPAADPAAEDRGAAPDRRAHVDRKLLESLVCPATRGRLDYDRAAGELISKSAGLAYPIRDGVPIMLVDEARKLDD